MMIYLICLSYVCKVWVKVFRSDVERRERDRRRVGDGVYLVDISGMQHHYGRESRRFPFRVASSVRLRHLRNDPKGSTHAHKLTSLQMLLREPLATVTPMPCYASFSIGGRRERMV